MHWQRAFKLNSKALANLNQWLVIVLLAASAPALSWPEWADDNSDDSPKRVSAAQKPTLAGPQAHYQHLLATVSAQSTFPKAFYRDDVDDGVQSTCLACHQAEGVAQQSGARLVLTADADANHQAFTEFLALDDTDGARILAKVTGQYGHGGGAVLTPSSLTYVALQDYLTMLGALTEGPQGEDAFWEGTAAEPRDITLRRAALLLAGQIPSAASLSKASESEAGLREQIMAAMSGPGFRDFVIRGANDRLLVDGLLNGLNFDIDTRGRYPALAELLVTLPEERPEEYEDYHDKPFPDAMGCRVGVPLGDYAGATRADCPCGYERSVLPAGGDRGSHDGQRVQ